MLGIVFLFAALAVAGVVYAGYRITNKVEQTAREHGVDLNNLTTAAKPARRTDPCRLLTVEEASRILGTAIERTEREESSGESMCHYFGMPVAPDESGRRVRSELDALDRKPTKAGFDPEFPENLLKAILGGAAGRGYFSIAVNWEEGRTELMAWKLMAAAAGPEMVTPAPGIGDDAVFGPLNCVLAFTKGATGVRLDLRLVPDSREKGAQLARLIDSRL